MISAFDLRTRKLIMGKCLSLCGAHMPTDRSSTTAISCESLRQLYIIDCNSDPFGLPHALTQSLPSLIHPRQVQYKLIDLTDCDLDDVSATALFDMIEYYEAAIEIDISENRKLTTRGWQSCINMIKRSQALQQLATRGTPLSESNAISMGKALLGASLNTLKLEHCGLSGRPMTSLCKWTAQERVLR